MDNKMKKTVTYSQKKEISLFLLIWPISPIIIYSLTVFMMSLVPNFMSSDLRTLIVMLITVASYWFIYGWIIALVIYYQRRKNYFEEHPEEKNKTINKIGKIFPILVCLIVFAIIVFVIINEISKFLNNDYENTSSTGQTIRLKISEEECNQYPNRYYFKDLCILCPDEQPLVDGHCQRCPEGELVLSIGCSRCDRDIDYLTPKAECDACPNRVYEEGVCRLSHKTRR